MEILKNNRESREKLFSPPLYIICMVLLEVCGDQ